MTLSLPIHVCLIDDDRAFAAALRRALPGEQFALSEVEPGGTLCRGGETPADVLLYGVETLTWVHLVELKDILARYPQLKVVIVAAGGAPDGAPNGADAQVLEAYRHGVVGYLLKGQLVAGDAAQLIRAVYHRQAILPPPLAGRILDAINRRAPRSSQEDNP